MFFEILIEISFCWNFQKWHIHIPCEKLRLLNIFSISLCENLAMEFLKKCQPKYPKNDILSTILKVYLVFTLKRYSPVLYAIRTSRKRASKV